MSIDPPLPPRRRKRRPAAKPVAPPPQKKWVRYLWVAGGGAVLLVAALAIVRLAGPRPQGQVRQSPAKQQAPATENVVVAAPRGALAGVSVEPATATPGVRLQAVVAPEPAALQGELVYRWFRNGTEIDEVAGPELDTAPFAKNDAITVEVERRVAGAEQERVRSLAVVLRNRAPVVEADSLGKVVDGRYYNEVRGVDPDKDPLTFSLENAPPGMEIDPATGRISWTLPQEAGEYAFDAVASDGTSVGVKRLRLTLGGVPAQ